MVKENLITYNDKNFKEFIISDGKLEASILEYGATIHKLVFDGTDCVAGYQNPESYLSGTSCQGATVGRYANRISNASFKIGEKQYILEKNDIDHNCLHSGGSNFGKKFLKGEKVSQSAVKFSLISKDGESGFPANVEFSVTFKVQNDTLYIEYEAVPDCDTHLSFTNHVYFTLGAQSCKEILLKINADYITPPDEYMIPTGEFMSVKDSAFDFNEPKKIGRDLFSNSPLILAANGYDHNFVLGNTKAYRKNVAVAKNEQLGITMSCSTDMPGVQLYTANGLNEKGGKDGKDLLPYGAFCLETQFFPDSPNKPQFPSTLVRGGQKFKSVTEYSFKK